MLKPSWMFCAVFCLSPISLAVIAVTNPWNPDSKPMIVKVQSVYLTNYLETTTTPNYITYNGTVDFIPNVGGDLAESDQIQGVSITDVPNLLTPLARNYCNTLNPTGYTLTNVSGGFSVGNTITSLQVPNNAGASQITYPGDVVCTYKNVTNGSISTYTMNVQYVWLIGYCPTGTKAAPFEVWVDEISTLRCIPKSGFSNANSGTSENSCSAKNPIKRPEDTQCMSRNPVHFGTGNKFLEEVDYTGSGTQPLKWVRYYNSQYHPLSQEKTAEVSIDSTHKLAKMISPLGAQWLHSYSSTLSIMTESNGTKHIGVYRPTGRTYQFEKNTSGNWVSSQGVVLDDKLVSQTDANGNITGWQWIQGEGTTETYDVNGKLLTITSREGAVTRLTYTTASGVYPSGAPSCTVPSGSPTAPASAPVNALLCITDPQGRQLNLQYNSNGQIQNVIDPVGKATQYTYTPIQTYTINTELDVNNNPAMYHQIQALSLSEVKYSDQGGKKYLYSESANVAAGTSASAWLITGIQENPNIDGTTNWIRFSTYKYNTTFQITQEYLAGNIENYTLAYSNTTPSNIVGPNGTYILNMFSNIVPTGNSGQIKPSRDGSGGQYTYDAQGNANSYTYPAFTTSIGTRLSNYTYDTQNRPTEIWEYRGSNNAQDSTTRHRLITWNTTFRLPAQMTEDIPFAKADGTVVPLGKRITLFTYDTKGRLTQKVIQSVDGSNQAVIESRTFQYTYDDTNGLGQLSTVKVINGSITSTLQTLTYYSANSSTYKKGDLNTIKNALNQITTFNSYDAAGRLLQSTDPNNVVTQYTYDNRGRVLTQSIAGRTTTFTWDGIGQLKKVVRPDNSSLTYTYDDAHRLTQIQDTSGNLLRAAYDNSSRVIAMDKVNTANSIIWRKEWKYDIYNNVTQERNVKGAAPTISMNTLNPIPTPFTVADDRLNHTPVVHSPLDTILPFMGAIQKAEALLKGERA